MPVMKRPKSIVTGQEPTDIPDVATFDASGALDMLPALVSIYRNMAQRKEGTKQFLESMANFAEKYKAPNLLEAAHWLAAKFPRVTAHMRAEENLSPMPWDMAVVAMPGGVKQPVPLKVGSKALDYGKAARIPAVNDTLIERSKAMLAHEATHTAQALGNKHMVEMYGAASDLVGYHQNPFELKAYGRQKTIWPTPAPSVRGVNAMKLLEQMSVEGGQDPKARLLRMLLRQRLGREPMAVSHVQRIP